MAPLLRALNQRVSRDGRQEVERTLMNLQALLEPLGSEANGELRAALDRMVHSLGKRFLHGPMQRIRQLGGEGEVDLLEEAALLLGVEATLLSVRELDDLAAAEDFDSGRRSGEK